jgi:glycosyltransferase involved in cell wall biosynthesis
MEKIISFAIPCYNSAEYMGKCIEKLALAGDEVEVLVVDDGSQKDNTFEIAKQYQDKYPGIVKAIHQENKGHGGAVNTGLANATGKYFKVVDSDDWVNTEDVKTVLDIIKKNEEELDLYITNYIYERVYDNSTHSVNYKKQLTPGKVITWEETKPFPATAPVLMHSLLYKTSLLRDKVGLKLPEHTFYVDNIYAYAPLAEVNKFYYVDIDFYHYFIGRPDQSVTTTNMFARYEQQIRVMTCMFKSHSYTKLKSLTKRQRVYLCHDLKQLFATTAFFVICGKDNVKNRQAAWKAMMKDFKAADKKLYSMLKYRSYATVLTWMPWPMKRFFGNVAYKVLAKKLKLGA